MSNELVPLSPVPTGWCIRLARLEGYDELALTLRDVDDYGRILGVSHKGDKNDKNPHIHFVIETSVKEKAIRKRMNTLFTKGKGNGHISIKAWDGNDNALSYPFHEDDENANIIISKGHSQDDIRRYIKNNAKVKVLVEEAKKKASWRLEEMVMVHYVQTEGTECNPSLLDVGMRIMETALANEMYPPQDWLLKAMAIKIVYKLSNMDTREQMINWQVRKALRLD